jgi:hypothetical protein
MDKSLGRYEYVRRPPAIVVAPAAHLKNQASEVHSHAHGGRRGPIFCGLEGLGRFRLSAHDGLLN